MRQRFKQQINLRMVTIADVKFSLRIRNDLPPVLLSFQYIFIKPALNEKVFEFLEKMICNGKKKTGRKRYFPFTGMVSDRKFYCEY